MLQFFFVLSGIVTTVYPRGTYYAKVNLLVLPPQEIYIHTEKPKEGFIKLKGTVNYNESFNYDFKNKKYTIEFKNGLKKILKKYRCKIIGFGYSPKEDVANVWLKLPLIGSTNIIFKRLLDIC